MYSLVNDLVRVDIQNHAAEIISFYDLKNEIEYMWQGDSKFWGNRNPILFPIVGSIYNKEYTIDGKTYKFDTNHGFTRNAEFTCVYQDDKKVVLEFLSNDETLRQYPFKFKLTVTYELKNKKLLITYEIKNENEFEMPFSFGLHPAFNVPFSKGDNFSDYMLEFSNNEDSKNILGDFRLEGKIIKLTRNLFNPVDTLCFEWLKSSYVKLTNGINSLKIGINGYRWFAIWTKKDAPFICLEPWHGHTDFNNTNVEFKNREGTIILEKGKSFTTSYYIEIE